MTRSVDLWLALSTTALDAFKVRRADERNEQPYSGPVKDRAFNLLNRMAKMDSRHRLFKAANAIPPFRETEEYVRRVLQYYRNFKNL